MQKAIWRFLNEPPQSAAINMACDEAIAIAYAEGKVRPTLRFYRWSEPSFSIGAFQELGQDWIDALEGGAEDAPLVLVRRITGGRALLHDRELTYSVVAGTNDPHFTSGIKGTYYAIAKGLLRGLQKLGIDAYIHRPSKEARPRREKAPLCFASTSWYEIAVGGKKMIGSAQRRWRGTFLQHGSLMIERSQRAFPDERQWVSEKQVSLSELLPVLPSHADLIERLKAGFEQVLDICLEPGRISPYEKERIDHLVREKYGNPGWNRFREDRSGSKRYSGRLAQNSL